jgi:hypothetical protein
MKRTRFYKIIYSDHNNSEYIIEAEYWTTTKAAKRLATYKYDNKANYRIEPSLTKKSVALEKRTEKLLRKLEEEV